MPLSANYRGLASASNYSASNDNLTSKNYFFSFLEYLYRIRAGNSVGSTTSPWIASNTGEDGKGLIASIT